MEARGDENVVVEALVEVGFTIVVEIVEVGQLISTVGVDDVIDDLEAEGLEKAACVAAPLDFGKITIPRDRRRDRIVWCGSRVTPAIPDWWGVLLKCQVVED